METTIFTQAAQLGGTVFVVIVFLWYLSKRDVQAHARDESQTLVLEKVATSNIVFAKALQKLTDVIESNSNINVKNTTKISENTTAVDKNTAVVSNGNGH